VRGGVYKRSASEVARGDGCRECSYRGRDRPRGLSRGPFDDLFILRDAQLEIAVNWGIAGFVWMIVGLLLAALLRQAGGVAVRPDGPREPRRDWRNG
jgi:hypothetical protein